MSTTSTDKQQAIELMEKAVEAIGEKIVEERGDMVVKMKVSGGGQVLAFTISPCFCLSVWTATNPLQPKVVSETDDAELKKLMDQFEAANMDVAGDDDSEEDDE
jgi:translation initiation factor 2 subunit 1